MTDEDLAKALTGQAFPEKSGLMSAIREVVEGIEIESPRWEYWRQVGAVKLWKAILLSCNRDPEWRTPNECYTQIHGAIWGGLAPLTNGQAAERLAVAKSRVGVDLPVFSPNQDEVALSTIELTKFIAWAMGMKWDMPEKLKAIVNLDGETVKAPKDESLGERERATLLTIIAALAKEAKIDISKPNKAADMIEGLTTGIGARVAARTIENHLKRIPDALERRAKT